MGWFTSKARDLGELPAISDPSHRWGNAKGRRGGAPLLMRFNQSAKEWCAHPGLPAKLSFVVSFLKPNPGGMPDAEELKQLDELEDTILREVESATIGLHALVLTNGVMKELIFYIPVPKGVDIKTIHARVAAALPTHNIECTVVNEPKWDSYQVFGLK
jgi:hypothetical protein